MELTSTSAFASTSAFTYPSSDSSSALPRQARAPAAGILLQVLDAIDYGVLLVDHERRVHHANRLGRQHLQRAEVLRMQSERLEVQDARTTSELSMALRSAIERGVRKTMHLSPRLTLAVIPAAAFAFGVASMALLMLSRPELCTPLALDAFAREHGLSAAETTVLHALAKDETPERVASAHGVALCTVRTQIISIRAKTGARSTRELLSRLARLPPMVGVLAD